MDISILMPVLNGAPFLEQQLDSLARQSRPPTRVIVSDDGSRDASPKIVAQFARTAPFEVIRKKGPGGGYGANAMSLLTDAPDGALAFCDQDDIWLEDRLARGARIVGERSGPALHVVARGGRRRSRPQGHRADCFAMALLRNGAPANATLINPHASVIIRRAAQRLSVAPAFPDWWIYGLMVALGVPVVKDPQAGLVYRSHRTNMLGSPRSIRGAWRRANYLARGTYGSWIRQNARALTESSDILPADAKRDLSALTSVLDHGWAGTAAVVAVRLGAHPILGAVGMTQFGEDLGDTGKIS